MYQKCVLAKFLGCLVHNLRFSRRILREKPRLFLRISSRKGFIIFHEGDNSLSDYGPEPNNVIRVDNAYNVGQSDNSMGRRTLPKTLPPWCHIIARIVFEILI